MKMGWSAPLNTQNVGVAGTALASSTALTDISATPNYTLPANFADVIGTTLRFTASGVFSTTSTPTLLFGVYYGGIAGTALAASTAITTASGVTSLQWRLEVVTTFRSLGTSGTAWSQGSLWLGASATAGATSPLPAAAPSVVTTDTTASKILTIGAQWGTSSASNTTVCHNFMIESVF